MLLIVGRNCWKISYSTVTPIILDDKKWFCKSRQNKLRAQVFILREHDEESFSMCVYYFKNWWHLQIQLDHQSSCDPFKIWFTLAHDMNFPGSLSFVMFIVFKKMGKYEWKINIWNILGILNDKNLSTCSDKLFLFLFKEANMTSILYIHVHICHQKDTF